MEQLQHFSHEHPLSLIQLHLDNINENSDKEDEEDKDENDFVVEEPHVGKCNMCEEEIYSFHLSYYCCKDCDYFLHKFCAQLPTTQQNHPLHANHNLTLSQGVQFNDPDFWNFSTVDAEWNMNHPSHPHQLQRYFRQMKSGCSACGKEHCGTFYHCTTCYWFMIHLDCALLPAKLLIQEYTHENFSHSHFLTLAYSFPYVERRAKFFPRCRVCDNVFQYFQWHYRCNKCQYYVHVDCATSTREAFMSSVLMPAGLGKTYRNFKDNDHPNLVCCPFPNESVNLLMHLYINKGELVFKGKIDAEMFSHPHPLILVVTHLIESVSLHDPMKKVELLCDGCVKPITDVPFYKCSQHNCGFVLHEWCTRLPLEIQDHYDHQKHTVVLLPNIPTKFLGLFKCQICKLPCNGFAYGCKQCEYYVDINCTFIPDVITHESHPNHLLFRTKALADLSNKYCKACRYSMRKQMMFHCPTCDFYLHTWCALLLSRTITHKYDKHPMSLRYNPAENHDSEYFCEICEDEFNPAEWFYHCDMCSSSLHTACAPLKHQCEQSTYSKYENPIFRYINVKFGGMVKIKEHPHPVTFVQGINTDGQCIACDKRLQYKMILKCFSCKFSLHYRCVRENPDA